VGGDRVIRIGQRLIRRSAYLRRNWPVTLAVGAIFRDEARYLPEWIEFHHRQGVECFYLYENDSSDDWQPALAPFGDLVELHRWPGPVAQFPAYSDCLERHRRDTRWIAFIDVDEFLFSPTGRSLPDVLDEFKRVPAVAANWRIYGTNGHEFPPEGSVIENYPVAEPDDNPINRLVKSIVFPAMTSSLVQNSHAFRYYARPVGEDGKRVSGVLRDPPTADLLRVNHYITRSRQEWEAKRRRRRVADGRVITGAGRYVGDDRWIVS
jgi:Glycosyltransferase family 92